MKHAAKENEDRVLVVSRLRNKVARLGQPNTDRDNPERKGREKKHRRLGHNSSNDHSSGSGTKIPEPFLLSAMEFAL